MDKVVLKMPRTESDFENGFNDGSIETYKNSPMLSLTKEELQNCTDAAIVENNAPVKVRVDFHDFELSLADFPDLSNVKTVFADEREYWDNYLEKDKKAVEFFDRALVLLNGQKIRCMRISDFNTTGLKGILSRGSSPWRNLVKSRGVSDKPKTATGSFGIGKDAAFACSELRTVFYNTINTDSSDNEAFQGSLKLPSYEKNGINYDGFGFFSAPTNDTKTSPLMENKSFDPGYIRTETGTDKYIIGFPDALEKSRLKKEVITSAIENFLLAFWNDKLVVSYDDIVVDKDHLQAIVDEYGDSLSKVTKEYYETLCAPDKITKISVFEDEDVIIYAKLIEGAERRAAIVRQSGMKVFDKGNISGSIHFSAVCILSGDKVNGYFKKMENPEHTKWSVDRADNPNEAKTKQNIIFTAIKEAVKDLAQSLATDTTDADGVGDYLPLAYTAGTHKRTEGLSNEINETKKAKKKKKKNNDNSINSNETVKYVYDEENHIIDTIIEKPVGASTGGSGSGNSGTGGQGGGTGGGNGNGTGGTGNNDDPNGETNIENTPGTIPATETIDGKYISKKKLSNNNFKFVLNEIDGHYSLKVLGENKVKSGFVEIKIASETDAVIVPVINATLNGNRTETSGNKISFTSLEAKTKNVFEFEFQRKGNWAIEVSINEN